eukprot:scaffold10124_cov57-Phaeocystis_antarctica.AAC.2
MCLLTCTSSPEKPIAVKAALTSSKSAASSMEGTVVQEASVTIVSSTSIEVIVSVASPRCARTHDAALLEQIVLDEGASDLALVAARGVEVHLGR